MEFGVFDHVDRSATPLRQFFEERIQIEGDAARAHADQSESPKRVPVRAAGLSAEVPGDLRCSDHAGELHSTDEFGNGAAIAGNPPQ